MVIQFPLSLTEMLNFNITNVVDSLLPLAINLLESVITRV